jgi:hypothetical protein
MISSYLRSGTPKWSRLFRYRQELGTRSSTPCLYEQDFLLSQPQIIFAICKHRTCSDTHVSLVRGNKHQIRLLGVLICFNS